MFIDLSLYDVVPIVWLVSVATLLTFDRHRTQSCGIKLHSDYRGYLGVENSFFTYFNRATFISINFGDDKIKIDARYKMSNFRIETTICMR